MGVFWGFGGVCKLSMILQHNRLPLYWIGFALKQTSTWPYRTLYKWLQPSFSLIYLYHQQSIPPKLINLSEAKKYIHTVSCLYLYASNKELPNPPKLCPRNYFLLSSVSNRLSSLSAFTYAAPWNQHTLYISKFGTPQKARKMIRIDGRPKEQQDG